MILVGVVLVCVVTNVQAGWIRDVMTTRGLDIGSGFSLHLDNNNSSNNSNTDSKGANSSLLEHHSLWLDYGGYGISVGKRQGKDAIEVGFYANENGEGRGKKGGDGLLPLILGFKATSLAVIGFAIIKALVLKSLWVAKLALIFSGILMLAKLLHHGHKPAFEVEHLGSEHHPVIVDYPGEELGYHSSASGNIYAYNNYIPSAVAESAINYAAVDPSAANATVTATPAQQAAAVSRRRDYTRRKPKPFVTVHRYSIET